MSRLFISAARKSSGKTSISIGLCAALRHRGLIVQPFKKGPDYIDPHWLALAAARPCYNLDFYTMERDEILQMVAARSTGADISLIEGNKGLYDGLDLDGSNSNAALAELLHTPVVLVLDARGMTRGIAPLILGYQAFDRNIDIRGVILNKLGGFRHERKLRDVIEHYTDVKVIGAVHQDARFNIEERHLGLVPGHEDTAASTKIVQLREAVESQVDLDALIEIAGSAPPLPAPSPAEIQLKDSARPDVRIGVVKNAAFGFYYPDDLEALEHAGATLVDIDNIKDPALADIDGLFIGGGFPETHMQALEANHGFREQLKHAIDGGLPVYAECGGLMYLARSITWKNERREMVGAIDGDIVMEERPQGRGYAQLQENPQSLWASPDDNVLPCHEFHYSRFINLDKNARFAFRVLRGTGIDGVNDGYIRNNMLACYIHQRNTQHNHWAQRFVAFVRQTRELKKQS
jgi:cobyrinic acid a,c-diamide synthase